MNKTDDCAPHQGGRDLSKFLQVLPFLLLAAETPPSCSPQTQSTAEVAPTPLPQLEDLSIYSTTDLDTYEIYCDGQVKNALARGDNARAQGWAKVRSAIAAEKTRRTQQAPEKTKRKYWHGTGEHRKRRYAPPKEEATTPKPTPESTAEPTLNHPEQFLVPPGWPVGPKQ